MANGAEGKEMAALNAQLATLQVNAGKGFDWKTIPGFKPSYNMAPVTQFADVRQMCALVESYKAVYPQYGFDEELTERNKSRASITSREADLDLKYQRAKHAITREKAVLDETKDVDANITALLREIDLTRKLTDVRAVKAERRERREANRHERNAAWEAAERHSKRARQEVEYGQPDADEQD